MPIRYIILLIKTSYTLSNPTLFKDNTLSSNMLIGMSDTIVEVPLEHQFSVIYTILESYEYTH